MSTPSIRPREELIAYGADRVSPRSLLAIVIGSGSRLQSAEVMADALLRDFGGLLSISQATTCELRAQHGIGEALATRIVASFQLGRRALEESLPSGAVIRGPDDVYQRMRGRLTGLAQEVFFVLALDARGRVIDEVEVARGSLVGVEVHPRDVFRALIRRSAFACVLVHNHPSGDPSPSDDDRALTARLAEAGQLVGIEVLDHLVIASGGFRSMAENITCLEVS